MRWLRGLLPQRYTVTRLDAAMPRAADTFSTLDEAKRAAIWRAAARPGKHIEVRNRDGQVVATTVKR